jgi:hypothetical protein
MNVQSISNYLETNRDFIIRDAVLNKASKDKQIIYGARAINSQVPTHLKKKTTDYDILTKKPKKSAKDLAKELNIRVGRNEYKVVNALHKGTFKVKDSKENTIVDYTQIKRTPKVKKSFGNSYKKLSSIKTHIKKSLRKPENDFRKEKDLDALSRIEMSEKTFDF